MKEDEIRTIGKQLVHYRSIGMRWCKLRKMFNKTDREMKRIISLYNALLAKKDEE